MPEPVTIGAMTLGGLAWVYAASLPVAAGAAGNVTDRRLCSLARGLKDRVAGLRGLPENRDVAKAMRLAQMQALETSIRGYREIGRPEWTSDAATRPDMFFKRSLAFCSRTVGRCRDPKVKLNLEVTEVLTAAIDGILVEPHDGPAAQRADALAYFSEEAVLDELRQALRDPGEEIGIVLPDGFEAHFRVGGAGRASFLDLFGGHVAEQIKHNQPFYRILTVGKLAGIEALAFGMAELLAAMDTRFGAALGRIESKVDEVVGNQSFQSASINSIVSRSIRSEIQKEIESAIILADLSVEQMNDLKDAIMKIISPRLADKLSIKENRNAEH